MLRCREAGSIATGVDLLTNELVRIAPEGRPLVVAFFAHWCPHCQREVDALTEWLLANKLPSNVDLLLSRHLKLQNGETILLQGGLRTRGGNTPSSPIQVLWRFQMPLVSRQSHILCLLRLTGQWLFASVETLVARTCGCYETFSRDLHLTDLRVNRKRIPPKGDSAPP